MKKKTSFKTAVIGKAVEGARNRRSRSDDFKRSRSHDERFCTTFTTTRFKLRIILPILWSRRRNLKGQMKEEAEGQVRTSLVLEAIAEAEKH